MTTNDGGPAFPRNHSLKRGTADGVTYTEADSFSEGMTLRDYFAAAALQGFASNTDLAKVLINSNVGTTASDAAAYAYRWADAMIAERAKE